MRVELPELRNSCRRRAALELANFMEGRRAVYISCDGTNHDLGGCAERRRESGVHICSHMTLTGVMRANDSCSVPAARRTLLEHHQLRM